MLLCARSEVQLSNVYLYNPVTELLPLCPLLFSRSLPDCPASFPSFLLFHFTPLLPFSFSYIFPQFGPTSVKITLLSSSLTCISVKLSTETPSLRRIKHTSLLTNSKRCATLLMSAALRSPALPVVLSPLFHLSFLLSPSTPLLLSPFSYVV